MRIGCKRPHHSKLFIGSFWILERWEKWSLTDLERILLHLRWSVKLYFRLVVQHRLLSRRRLLHNFLKLLTVLYVRLYWSTSPLGMDGMHIWSLWLIDSFVWTLLLLHIMIVWRFPLLPASWLATRLSFRLMDFFIGFILLVDRASFFLYIRSALCRLLKHSVPWSHLSPRILIRRYRRLVTRWCLRSRMHKLIFDSLWVFGIIETVWVNVVLGHIVWVLWGPLLNLTLALRATAILLIDILRLPQWNVRLSLHRPLFWLVYQIRRNRRTLNFSNVCVFFNTTMFLLSRNIHVVSLIDRILVWRL